jgi:hypothetical protein
VALRQKRNAGPPGQLGCMIEVCRLDSSLGEVSVAKSATVKEVSIQPDLDVREPLVVSISLFNDQPRLDVRHYYENAEGELGPTRKGINVPLDNILPLIDAMLVAYTESTGQRLGVFPVDEEGE